LHPTFTVPVATPPSASCTPPQIPVDELRGFAHGICAQQSPEVEHVLPAATQVAAEHWPLTHGLPQQSALVAHAVPPGTGQLAV
jgi:hypothetical protein